MKIIKCAIFIIGLSVVFNTVAKATYDAVVIKETLVKLEEYESNIKNNKNTNESTKTNELNNKDSLDNIEEIKEENKEENKNSESKNINNTENKEDLDKDSNIKESKLKNKNDNFIFIGDFRTIGMSRVVDIKDYEFITFISQADGKYDWFLTEGLPKLEQRLNTTDLNYNIVLNLGINDTHNGSKYAKLYNELELKYPNHNFIVVSVNPENEEKMIETGYKFVGNKYIEEFNKNLKKDLSNTIPYIDTYTDLVKNGFETKDGLHYTSETSKHILDTIYNSIKNM